MCPGRQHLNGLRYSKETHECSKILLCQAGSRAEVASCVGVRSQLLPGDSVSSTTCLALCSEEEDGRIITTLLTNALFSAWKNNSQIVFRVLT